MNTNFPDADYLRSLAKRLQGFTANLQDPTDEITMYSSALMNSVADYITDENVFWKKQTIRLDDLWLTGTNPEWNRIILDRCEHSPQQLHALFQSEPAIVNLFERARFDPMPILVVHEDEKNKVFDGMHRTIAAIREGRGEITAFMAIPQANQAPRCEAHVVYDLLKPYMRRINTNRAELVGALRYLRHSYANVDDLLKNRFNAAWVPNNEVQSVIQEALLDPS